MFPKVVSWSFLAAVAFEHDAPGWPESGLPGWHLPKSESHQAYAYAPVRSTAYAVDERLPAVTQELVAVAVAEAELAVSRPCRIDDAGLTGDRRCSAAMEAVADHAPQIAAVEADPPTPMARPASSDSLLRPGAGWQRSRVSEVPES